VLGKCFAVEARAGAYDIYNPLSLSNRSNIISTTDAERNNVTHQSFEQAQNPLRSRPVELQVRLSFQRLCFSTKKQRGGAMQAAPLYLLRCGIQMDSPACLR
jgi:hypothetical protein